MSVENVLPSVHIVLMLSITFIEHSPTSEDVHVHVPFYIITCSIPTERHAFGRRSCCHPNGKQTN